ncbi:conjugal transfer protein TrbL, partial [Rhizobium leguminosarum]|nr:conjugal transfer protein TrbL [Rhizobium ruizarguesonis]
ENALAIVLAMVLYLALISYFIFQVPDFARTFSYGTAISGVPGGGGVDTGYSAARRTLASSNSRAGQAGAVALGMLAGPRGAVTAAALAGRGSVAGVGALGRMLTNRRRNSE